MVFSWLLTAVKAGRIELVAKPWTVAMDARSLQMSDLPVLCPNVPTMVYQASHANLGKKCNEF